MELIDSSVFSSYLSEVNFAVNTVNQEKILEVIDCMTRATINQGRLWIIGNGGSSATASHFAADLMRQSNQEVYKVRASCLSESTARVTAIGNDYEFEEIFARQIWSLANEGDVLCLLSASGNSQNLVRGVRTAKSMGIETIALVGFEGGALKKESDLYLHFRTQVGSYEIAEDAQSIACHFIAMNVRNQLDIVASKMKI